MSAPDPTLPYELALLLRERDVLAAELSVCSLRVQLSACRARIRYLRQVLARRKRRLTPEQQAANRARVAARQRAYKRRQKQAKLLAAFGAGVAI